MSDATRPPPAQRCFFLQLGDAGTIIAKIATTPDALAHFKETVSEKVAVVDAATFIAAKEGGRYSVKTKKLTPPPPPKVP